MMSFSVNTFTIVLIIFLLFCQFSDIFCQELNEDENEEETFLISGGYRLKTHDKAKYAVSVRKRFVKTIFGDTHLCGGSIISSKVILTSAHCMFISDAERQYNANELSVIIGTPNRLNRTLVSERLLVSHIKIHEKFSNDAVYWDIALMILYKNIKLNGWSAAIVPLSVVPAKIGTICTALGWGRLYENGPITNQVTYIDVPLLDYNTCTRLMPNFGEGQFCAADGEDLQKDACEGDVGGPLICDEHLSGVITATIGCDSYQASSIYTNVSHFVSWIQKNISCRSQRFSFFATLVTCLHFLIK